MKVSDGDTTRIVDTKNSAKTLFDGAESAVMTRLDCKEVKVFRFYVKKRYFVDKKEVNEQLCVGVIRKNLLRYWDLFDVMHTVGTMSSHSGFQELDCRTINIDGAL